MPRAYINHNLYFYCIIINFYEIKVRLYERKSNIIQIFENDLFIVFHSLRLIFSFFVRCISLFNLKMKLAVAYL